MITTYHYILFIHKYNGNQLLAGLMLPETAIQNKGESPDIGCPMEHPYNDNNFLHNDYPLNSYYSNHAGLDS